MFEDPITAYNYLADNIGPAARSINDVVNEGGGLAFVANYFPDLADLANQAEAQRQSLLTMFQSLSGAYDTVVQELKNAGESALDWIENLITGPMGILSGLFPRTGAAGQFLGALGVAPAILFAIGAILTIAAMALYNYLSGLADYNYSKSVLISAIRDKMNAGQISPTDAASILTQIKEPAATDTTSSITNLMLLGIGAYFVTQFIGKPTK